MTLPCCLWYHCHQKSKSELKSPLTTSVCWSDSGHLSILGSSVSEMLLHIDFLAVYPETALRQADRPTFIGVYALSFIALKTLMEGWLSFPILESRQFIFLVASCASNRHCDQSKPQTEKSLHSLYSTDKMYLLRVQLSV